MGKELLRTCSWSSLALTQVTKAMQGQLLSASSQQSYRADARVEASKAVLMPPSGGLRLARLRQSGERREYRQPVTLLTTCMFVAPGSCAATSSHTRSKEGICTS